MTPHAARIASLMTHSRSMTADPTEAAAILVAAAALIVVEAVPEEHVGTALAALIDPWLARPDGMGRH